ncbi:hypothetical protein EYD45_08410 [Hyunsoonleella flava]|uniref:PKD domain-containing protein n=1 Tax=Hyunsoonleella flava TaxID=2527939 RepID=A0A4Q9FJC6_9FLAO|nr:PKD domain-containing protein [Hyunsoonleella flava]TBN04024.1 hypothetical protein EYD45_08410 [Hyunsoonleella flava]
MDLLKKGIYVLSILLVGFITSCEQEDDLNIIAGLDFTVATLNPEGTEAGVVPTTVPGDGRIVYSVDFGDPASADDVFMTSGPMVTYVYPEESATYTITVTASLSGKEDVTITKEHTVVFTVEPDPVDAPPIVGTWKLAPEAGALGVGPALNDVSWWSNSAEDVTTRACLFDDEYVFNQDGTFQNVMGDQTWIEPWQGAAAEECGAPVFPHDGSASATYTYANDMITINGRGAFLGLAKVVNGAELASPADAADSVTYMATLVDDNTLELDIEVAGGGHWSFKLVKEAPPAISPVVGTWKLAPEAAALGVGPALNDISWWSNSSEDVTTRACLFDDEYVFNEDGTFQNILGSETWLEGWQGNNGESCGAPIFPHDGTASATYTYDAGAGTITINGRGAFLGLAKVVNGAELASPADTPDSVTYIATVDGNTMELDIEVAGGGHWSFKLVKEAPPANPLVGTWTLAPEAAALGVGPALNDISWWSNSSEDVTTRACLFDDEYVFNNDGSFQNILGSETWLEGWQGNNGESCGTPIFPHDGTATATYTYDESAGTITIDGKGAFLGLAKVVNGAELASPADAPDSVTYMASLDGNTLELDIEVAGGGHWSFKLVKQ